jgi:hypothetical protein
MFMFLTIMVLHGGVMKIDVLVATTKEILTNSEELDLDDGDYCSCVGITCTKCPAYELGDETPTDKCKMFFLRNWYWDNVLGGDK